jgi:hypothetical protein
MSRTPLVSICLPVLNAGRFLENRLASILSQTYENWELVVVDNYSDDGTWERLQTAAFRDERVRLRQAPREGMYANWNNTLRASKGELIYVATADDTMQPGCLQKLVELATKEENPCIAQCGLELIDECDRLLPKDRQWPHNTEWFRLYGDFFAKPHLRRAPFDGAGILLFGTIITSITQALFPRDVFERIGGFPNEFGSAGDMAWEGLAGFFYDVNYTPECLATWRMHDTQATQDSAAIRTWPARRIAICDWIVEQVTQRDPQLGRLVERSRLTEFSRFWQRSLSESRSDASCWQRGRTALLQATDCPRFYSRYLCKRLLSQSGDAVTETRSDFLTRFLDLVERPTDLNSPKSDPVMRFIRSQT